MLWHYAHRRLVIGLSGETPEGLRSPSGFSHSYTEHKSSPHLAACSVQSDVCHLPFTFNSSRLSLACNTTAPMHGAMGLQGDQGLQVTRVGCVLALNKFSPLTKHMCRPDHIYR